MIGFIPKIDNQHINNQNGRVSMALTFNPKIFQDIEEKYTVPGKKKLSKVYAKRPERLKRFSTVSDKEIKDIYTPTPT
jgi:hypothetical protein